ncbi:MAG: hypothetical protein P5702_25550 [Limnospira sp. PMC 1291.21]|uniref:Uncharacterized protein n=2 Tax=Limnospira TaxID=2596745 RepID=B5W1Y2_LIMMA|nr:MULTISPECIES: hypothetical protein [Limnospira]UWU45569.1 hypothetical protein APLC1_0249 [Arthrospira platensis C1]EDZ94411.1 conserved hypothetical protein [Limnospira maxima CS-328]MDT9180921.1 hypothetical protein [Limnospira sp. PMC 1238.20]MDT9191072.1 hypothetical protein [Limnospira sp. PMC 894.15]MDT9196256.1 hypothetical protein [Limnospira sp. PMC 1245.20]
MAQLFKTGRLTVGYVSKSAYMPLPAFQPILKQQDIPLDSQDEVK